MVKQTLSHSPELRKQMFLLTVLAIGWRCRYGWKLRTGFAGRVADVEEKPRLYLRGGAVAGVGHRGEHSYLHHYQRCLPAPASGGGTLSAGGNVYPRHLNSRCGPHPPAHRHFTPELRGLPRPEHGFLRPGHGHFHHSAELGQASRASTAERLAGERELLRSAWREALSRAH